MRWGAGLADPALPVRLTTGVPSLRGGDSPQGFPLEAIAARSATGAKVKGIEPNGRDAKGGTGQSPKARRRCALTRAISWKYEE